MGLFDDLMPATDAPVKITVRPPAHDMAPEGYASNPRGYSTQDVQAALRGDMFNTPGMPIKYAAQPGQTFGVDATRNAQPFDSIVAHHTGGPTLQGALNTARNGDPFRADVKYGYHFYIDKDGTVVQGAPMDARTNHVQPPGAAQRTSRPDIGNSNSVGISFVGDSSNPTPEQLSAAQNLSKSLMNRYGIQANNVVGHGQIQANRQTSEGMPLVNAIQGQQAVAQAPQWQGPQMGGVANAAPPQTAPAQQKPTGLFSDIGPAQQPDIGRGKALLTGATQGLTANFGDELAGVVAAGGNGPMAPYVGLAKLGYEYLTGSDEAAKKYAAARDEFRGQVKTAEQQYPGTYLTGNVLGGMTAPVGGALNAATIPARIGRSAAVGAGIGGLSGAGEGETVADRATRGAGGIVAGGAVGAAAVPVIGAAGWVGKQIAGAAAPVVDRITGAIRPESKAAKTIVQSIDKDSRGVGAELTPQEYALAQRAGAPVANVELGGETTRAWARWAANSSPEARATLDKLANDRFEGQTDRAVVFLKNIAGVNTETTAVRDALKAQSRRENTPAYNKAYAQPNAQGMWDEGFEQIAQAPAVQDAIRAASVTAANRGTAEGLPRIRSPFAIDKQTGGLSLRVDENGNRVLPNLEFWDHVKRGLDKMPEARTLNDALKAHLDDLVPDYKVARAGAARFFGADDMITAGMKFVRDPMSIGDAAKILGRASPADREMFKVGFMGKIIDDVGNTGDRVNVMNKIAGNPNARTKLQMVLGPNGYRQLDAMMTVEQSMDKLRTALGNSSTVRQWVELGMAGGLGATGAYSFDPNQLGLAAIVGGKRYVDQRVARHVANMLVSSDPNVLAKGIRQVAGNKNLFAAFRDLEMRLARAGAQQSPTPALQAAGVGRAEDDQPQVPRPPGQ